MHFEWDFGGRTYWFRLGFGGKSWFIWSWRLEEGHVIPSSMYRAKPFTLTIFDKSISLIDQERRRLGLQHL